MSFSHQPVMLNECIELLNIQPNGIYVDGTAGGAGHSKAIAQKLTTGFLYAIDQDPDAIAVASERLSGLPAKVLQGNYKDVKKLLNGEGIFAIDGAFLDLGVSSHQLDTADRGFSYRADAPLDMRMSQQGLTAADIVNTKTRQELADIFRQYGEEPYAWQIAGKIVSTREDTPIYTTVQLADIIKSALPPAVRRKDKNPSRRVFQALRIEVNGELDVLNEGLDDFFSLLKPKGRLAVLTFHSLEDRIVKQRFKKWAVVCTCPPELPMCICKRQPEGIVLTKKPIYASTNELAENKRSRSAKLRVIEKCALPSEETLMNDES